MEDGRNEPSRRAASGTENTPKTQLEARDRNKEKELRLDFEAHAKQGAEQTRREQTHVREMLE